MNTKMKVLSLALIGAFGYVGAAAAACPAGPAQADGGAWSSAPVLFGSVAIATPGLDGTECRLNATIDTLGGNGLGFAYVQDDTPAAETRYRAQFLINLDDLNPFNAIFTDAVQVFAAAPSAPANGVLQTVRLSVVGSGTSRSLNVFTADTGATGNVQTASTPLTTGTNTVEIDWQSGVGLKVWVNSGNEATPTLTLTAANGSWGGVDTAYLGLSTATADYVTDQAGKFVQFDKFDSRRQTFIGL